MRSTHGLIHCNVDLVEKIYAAQKERDAAMLGRLTVANQQRDEALTKLTDNRAPDR